MNDHFVLNDDHPSQLISSEMEEPWQKKKQGSCLGTGNSPHFVTVCVQIEDSSPRECRICQEEEEEPAAAEEQKLESPCSCSGSLKFAHRKCIQRWCNQKGDTTCEICGQPFKGGYTAPLRSIPPQDIHIDFGNLHMLPNESHLTALEFDEYANSGSACFRSTAFLLMALLLLRHALIFSARSSEEDIMATFIIYFLRAAGFVLPCYMMARTMNILQRRRQQQEEAMAMLLQTRQYQGPNVAANPTFSAPPML